jgi:hypothetical protein
MLQIAIGRNIGSEPMSDNLWLWFQQTVEETVMIHTLKGIADTKANGVSNWENVSEDTCIFVWFDLESLPEVVYEELATIAKQYEQDAIAVTFGETKFVGMA